MSYQIANINTLAFVVGTTTTVSWQQLRIPLPIAQQMRPDANAGPVIVVYNESGCQFLATLPVSGQTFTLAAGRWTRKRVPPDEVTMTLQVQQVAGAALYNRVLVDYYTPGEPLEDLGVLGNSPVGGNALTITANQVINDGLVAPQTIVESTPSASAQTILMTTDGKLTLVDTGSGQPLALTSPTPGNGDEILLINGHDTTVNSSIGIGDSSSTFSQGLWAFDHKNNGTIFKQGTTFGIIFNGAISANMVASMGGQTTVGSFGVAPIVAQAINVLSNVNTLQNILSFTPPVTGAYRVHASVLTISGAGNGTFTVRANYHEPNNNATFNDFFLATDGVNSFVMSAAVIPYGRKINCSSDIIYADGTAPIIVQFQDSANTQNSRITAFIERLS